MTSACDERMGEPVENLISGEEDFLCVAAPAKDQMIGLQFYMSRFIHQEEQTKETYGCIKSGDELVSSDNEIGATFAFDAAFSEVDRSLKFAKKEFLRIQAFKDRQIRSLENERRGFFEQAQRDSDERTHQRTLYEDNMRLKKAAEDQRKSMEKNLELFAEKYEHLRKKNETLQLQLSAALQSGSHKEVHKQLRDEDQLISTQQDTESIYTLYRMMFTNMWPVALNEGKQIFHTTNDYVVGQKLLIVLEEVISFCNQECQRQWSDLKQILQRKSDTEPPHEIISALKHLRKSTQQSTVESICQSFQKEYGINLEVRSLGSHIKPFVNECIRIGWLMSLHEPRIVIKPNVSYGSLFDENVYEQMGNIGDHVEFVVWPALMYENGQIVAKGIARCFKQDTNLSRT